MALQKRKTRMYEPWGYRDENNYQSVDIIQENELDSFFANVSYDKDDNKIHFSNRDGLEVGSLDVNEFVKSDQIIERTWYEDGKIYIKFTNGDLVTIDIKEVLDETEFKDGLQVVDGIVSVLKDPTSENWLTVSIDGVKVSGIQDEIDRIDGRIDDEIDRATSEEQRIEDKLDDEIARATSAETALDTKIEDETTRATSAETALNTKIEDETTRATRTEEALNFRVNTLNDKLDAEESIREANDAALGLRITTETNDRIAAVTAEKNRAVSAETELNNRIDEIISGSTLEKLDELIEKLGYKDNNTLVLTNEHEVAFGEYNVSNTDTEPSGQTVFSIGIGTSAHDRKNAIEVRKDGTVYMWVEGDFMSINELLGQIAHEVYDNG